MRGAFTIACSVRIILANISEVRSHLVISKRIKSKVLNRRLYIHVHCSISHDRQDVEEIHASSKDEQINEM